MSDLPYHVVGLAFLFSLVLTPVVRRLALRLGIVDAPDGHRKLHGRTVPLCGGVAVFAAMAIALGVGLAVNVGWGYVLRSDPDFMIAAAVASVLIVGLGLVDDRFVLRGRQKFVGQVLVVLGLVWFGDLTIRKIELFGSVLELGPLAIPFTMFWLLGAINALNLIDGVDGLATTVGIIVSAAIAVMASMTNHHVDAVCSLAMAGSLAGFLIYNLPPAKIFLGDAGSMLIGLVLGVLAIRSSLKGPATVALAAPTVIWGVLIFDVGMAILRRKLTGRSLYTTDRGHLHHVLQERGFSGLGIVVLVGLLCAVCAGGALVSVYLKDELMAVATLAAVLGTLVASRFFGHSECGLLAQKIKRAAVSMVRFPHKPRQTPQPLRSRFQGKREWEVLWEALLELAERFDLCTIRLNVNSPAIGEEYHASWERKEHPGAARLWRTEIPLFQGNLTIGRLSASGAVTDDSAFGYMSEFLDALRPFEEQLHAVLAKRPAARADLVAGPSQ
ncbi:MAG: undecaprenyl/decaprenyl-phosphate alpha-N-acetylglucosaminyl 1-phosphate transferase [Planctomyces sp.]|nr:undecaprenyl/decaprenyl-phosphate alpha-N-acetylglucosaminyl 1-phosphate transferase [Planctomyces sp.]